MIVSPSAYYASIAKWVQAMLSTSKPSATNFSSSTVLTQSILCSLSALPIILTVSSRLSSSCESPICSWGLCLIIVVQNKAQLELCVHELWSGMEGPPARPPPVPQPNGCSSVPPCHRGRSPGIFEAPPLPARGFQDCRPPVSSLNNGIVG